YYPFGMQMQGREFAGGMGYRWGFNGMSLESENGSLDFGHRNYNDRLSRFCSLDPVQFYTTIGSGYSYAGNQPINSIDAEGMIRIVVITHETQTDGSIQEFRSEFEITTVEDVRGIERSTVVIHRYSHLEPVQVNNNTIVYRSVIDRHTVDANSGETYGENWKRTSPYEYALAKAMIKNPLGTGFMAQSMFSRDLFTREYLNDKDKKMLFANGLFRLFSAGNAASNSTSQAIMNVLISVVSPENKVDLIFNVLGLNDNNKLVVNSYLNKFIRENDQSRINALQSIIVNTANNSNLNIGKELKNRMGIDIEMPIDKHDAVRKAVDYDKEYR
ncbi:MAG: RHS repeat-associated core domain-containing protein, partial [Bacteroidota bacterium]